MIQGGAGGGHDRSAVSFPDQTQFLPAPTGQDELGMLPWAAQAPLIEGNQQIHKQAEIRVRVSPTPYAKEARENYAESWRTRVAAE